MALGRSFMACVPLNRHSLAKSRQNSSKTMRFSFRTLVIERYRKLTAGSWISAGHCLPLMEGWQDKTELRVLSCEL